VIGSSSRAETERSRSRLSARDKGGSGTWPAYDLPAYRLLDLSHRLAIGAAPAARPFVDRTGGFPQPHKKTGRVGGGHADFVVFCALSMDCTARSASATSRLAPNLVRRSPDRALQQ
jgi:hypothetical protein